MRCLDSLVRFSFTASLIALSSAALAEGAVRVLDCSVVQRCDASGKCEAASDKRTFRMEPVNLQDDGSGSYVMVFNDKKTDMQALSFAGPFYWSTTEERNTLLVSSETEFLWHQLTLTPTPSAHINYMRCKFTQ